MSIRKLTQVLLSLSFVFTALFAHAASAQAIVSRNLPYVPSRIVERVDDANLVTLHGNTNRMVRPQFDRGLVDPSLPMNKMMLVLKRSPEQEAALAAFNARQLDPSSPDFHHWLHADEFGQTYGPSDADMATITAWLERQGFRIDNVSKGRINIQFSGTAAQVQNAFHVEMHHYLVEGKMHLANDRDPQIPAALEPVVAGVASLHDFFGYHMSHLGGYVKRDPATGKLTRVYPEKIGTPQGVPEPIPAYISAKPQSSGGSVVRPNLIYADEDSGLGVEDLSPADFAMVYNINPTYNAGITGKGVTVAITATSDIVESDVTTYRSTFGLPAATINYIQSDPNNDPGLIGPSENTEDLEMVSAAAPGATLDLVVSAGTATTQAFDLSDQYIVDNEIAPIMTVSYGICELKITTAGNTNANQIFQQGATEGITIFVATGDSGAATCERQETGPDSGDVLGLQVSGYASSPYVTAVGGTDFDWSYGNASGQAPTYWWNTTNGTNFVTAKGYIPEIAWNTTCANPLLLDYFQNADGTPSFTSTEGLCNTAASSSAYDGLVDLGSGGGGYSHCTTNSTTSSSTTWDPNSCSGGYAKPSWQTGTGVPADGKRDLPDIAMFASFGYLLQEGYRIDSTEILVCITDTNVAGGTCSSGDYTNPADIIYQENGGTSAASPFTAGVMALVLQKTGEAQGLINPVLYGLAAKQSPTTCNAATGTVGNGCYFNDVQTGSNAQNCLTGGPQCVTTTSGDQLGVLSGYSAGAGYDQATGLGSLNVTNIVNGWPATAKPTFTFSPTSLTFPSTTVGVISASQSVTVKNTGTTSATFTSIGFSGTDANDFAIPSQNCPSPIAAGASCTVSVNFDPGAAGTRTASLVFTDSASGSPQTVALTGTGAAAALTVTVSPTSLTFASTTVGSTTAAQVVTVKNTSASAVTLGTIGFTGSAASSYVQSATTCTTSLAASASCTISVEFKPAAAGSLTASLSIADNATGSPQLVALSGTGTAAALTVTVSPTTLTFASTAVGSTTAAQVVTVKNTSASAVTLGTIGFTGTSASSFLQSATTCTTSLAASASCTISVEFKPTAAGTLTASLSIADNATGSPQLVALSGTGTGGSTGLTITPSSLTFPSTTVGTTAATQVITLKNATTVAVSFTASTTITGSGASSFAKTASTCTNPLPAGASCTNTISFTPAAAGTLTATVTYTDSASTTPQTVALSGTGAGASTGLTITPSSLTFPSTTVGTTAATQVITLKNATTAAVSFTASTTITGSGASSFAKTASTCTNPLPAGASCTNTISFTPAAAGTLTATVTYTDSASTTPQTVALTGTGASSGTTTLSVSVTSLAFPNTAEGSTSDLQTVTLTNTGTLGVTLSSIALGGTNATSFVDLNGCGATLAASATCSVYVAFKPAAAGALTGTLTITDNATGSPQKVTLTGTGTAVPALKLSATTLAFGTVKAGSNSAVQTLTLTNSGTATVVVDAITLGGTNATSFLALNTCGATLTAGATCTVYVGFTPTVTGSLTASLSIVSNGSGSPQAVTLTGTGD